MRQEPRRIAVFRMGHIGDTIIALPALWTVRKRFPHAHIVYLSQANQVNKFSQGTEVLRSGTVFDETFSYTLSGQGVTPLQILKTLLRLRFKRIDTLIYIPPFRTASQLARDRKFFRLAGIKRIIGMNGYQKTDYRPVGTPLPSVKHEADILLSHLALDGVEMAEDSLSLMDMGLSSEERNFAADWLQKRSITGSPIIGIGPGSKMPAKLWPTEHFIEVVRQLDARYHPTFLVFGSPAEREVCQQICDAVTNSVNTAGEFSIRQSAAIFEHCQLYIGNDTGTMHIAAASKVPCVAVFSARDWPGRWFPYGPQHKIHRVVVPCEGCMLEVCPYDNLCVKAITTDRIVQSAVQILDGI